MHPSEKSHLGTAISLSRRGYKVSLLDANPTLADFSRFEIDKVPLVEIKSVYFQLVFDIYPDCCGREKYRMYF